MDLIKKSKRMAGILLRTGSLSFTKKLYNLGEQGRAISLSLNYPVSMDSMLGVKKGTLRERILELSEETSFLEHVNEKVRKAGEELNRRGLKGTVGVFNYGPLLYAIVRTLKPSIMIETGVASGTSSACILKAMETVGKGKLISIDLPMGDTVDPEYTEFQFKRKGSFGPTLVPPDLSTGYAIPENLKRRWELILGDAKVELPKAVARAGSIDMFMHDSEHSYEHMMFEFESIYPFLTQGGLVLSDDVSWNDSFRDFARKAGKPCLMNPIGFLVK